MIIFPVRSFHCMFVLHNYTGYISFTLKESDDEIYTSSHCDGMNAIIREVDQNDYWLLFSTNTGKQEIFVSFIRRVQEKIFNSNS